MYSILYFSKKIVIRKYYIDILDMFDQSKLIKIEPIENMRTKNNPPLEAVLSF